ncbi:MAG TPA: pectate lyase [Anaeromyxobacter sp.]|nr:pectate lyase [Anaeromyxobacter sp.]
MFETKALGRWLSAAALLALLAGPAAAQTAPPTRAETVAAMKKATRFMMDKVAYRAGFLWNYTPDLSRGWGEMEAYRTMVWMQSPGTSTVGHMLLDAYHATGDEYFYHQAVRVAETVIRAQHKAGGWHYMYDYAGEKSIKRWYETIGSNGWRLEEFLHYYGNATFDDAVTTEAATFLLRMYLEKREHRFRNAVLKAADFIVQAQYHNGGWPQRHPYAGSWSYKGKPDYTRYITLNDNVAQENIQFLVEVYQTMGLSYLLPTIQRGMDVFIEMQGPPGQPAFALQYTPALQPIGARTYEPDSYATHTTQSAIQNLLVFYEITADPKYLQPIDEALEWLDRVRLPVNYPNKPANRTHATFIEFGTDHPIFVKRKGTNIVNGAYFAEVDPNWKSWPDGQDPTVVPSASFITHYNSWRDINTAALRTRKAALEARTPEDLRAASPLYATGLQLPAFFSFKDVDLLDLINAGNGMPAGDVSTPAAQAIAEISTADYWAIGTATPNEISNPYIGPGPSSYEGDPNYAGNPLMYSQTKVGDRWDTSPYDNVVAPVQPLISTRQFITKMGVLMRHVYNLDHPVTP